MMTPQHVIPESPWFLGEDYSAEDIVFDDKGGVRAGTLRGLIARLTPHGQTGESAVQCKAAGQDAHDVPLDTSFFQCFLLTFRSFTNPPELFELLVERYNIEEPEGLNAGEALDWRKLKQTPIRLRSVAIPPA
jgi:son of sevenless-like protein